jgi:hypothetical protein
MGSFLYKRENGILETPTSAAWINTHSNMLVISYKNQFFGLFDRVTVNIFQTNFIQGHSRGIVNIEKDRTQA